MRKFLMTMVLMFSMLVGLNAQTAIQTSKVFDNTYVGVNIGAYTPLDFDHMFPLNATVGVRVGKNFSPVFGLFVEDQVAFGNNHFGMTNANNVVRANHLTLNGDMNLTNLFAGYNDNRKFTVSAIGGLGWLQMFNPGIDESDYNDDDLTARTGLKFAWNVGKENSGQLFVEPDVVWNLTRHNSGAQMNKHYGQLGVVVGYVYKFKTSNGTHDFKTYDIGAMNDEINALRAELAKKPTEVEKVIENVVEKEVEKVVEVATGGYVVYFSQGSYKLTDLAKATLDEVPAGSTVCVQGYASPEGTKRFNQKLSEDRANVVAEYLKGRNIEVSTQEAFGNTGEIQNRVVVITVK